MTEAHHDSRTARHLPTFLLLGLAIVGTGPAARADRITVRGGGHLKGKLIPDKAHPGQFLYIGEVGKTPMPFKKDQILQVIPEKSALDDYVVRLAQDRSTAEAEFELGAWCEQAKLADLAQVHYDRAVKLDSTFGPAHQKLGHVLMGGRWLDGDELKESQGLVKFKGRWVRPEEKERRESLAASVAEGNTWVKRVRMLRDAFVAGPAQRSQEAEKRLLAIDQPVAIGPVMKVLGDDPIPALRSLGSRILGGISGPEASLALVNHLLIEEDQDVRQATMNELTRREASEVVPLLAKGLRSTLPQVVNRAAWGLGNLNALAMVPQLIPALITYQSQVVMVEDAGVGRRRLRQLQQPVDPDPDRAGRGSGVGRLRRHLDPLGTGPWLVDRRGRRIVGAGPPGSPDRESQRRGSQFPGQADRGRLRL
jgi:hypothetical protein